MNQPLNLQDAILNLQRYLRTISFIDSRITRVPLDGLFDTQTQRAVSEYQRTRGLEDTGIVDKNTWDTLFEEYMLVTASNDRSKGVNLFPETPEDYEAALGDEHIFITLVQIILRELSATYDGFPELEISGVFDEPTEQAVKVFQIASMLEPTGRIDLVTWNRMTEDFSNYSSSR